jgi:hypothetical protein
MPAGLMPATESCSASKVTVALAHQAQNVEATQLVGTWMCSMTGGSAVSESAGKELWQMKRGYDQEGNQFVAVDPS